MQKLNKKKLLTIAGILVIAGIIITGVGLLFGGNPGFQISRDGIHLAKNSGFTQDKKKLDSFNKIDMHLSYAELNIIPSDGFYIEYQLGGTRESHTCEVKNNTLTFRESDAESITIIGFNWDFNKKYVNLYVPKEQYFETLLLVNESGDIQFDSLNVADADIALEYGDLDGNSLNASGNVNITLDSGELNIKTATAETLVAENEYGDISFDKLTCETANISLDSGDLSLNHTDIKHAEMDNEYGDIDIILASSLNNYDLDLYTDYGDLDVAGRQNTHEDGSEETYQNISGKSRTLKIYCDSGDIDIRD